MDGNTERKAKYELLQRHFGAEFLVQECDRLTPDQILNSRDIKGHGDQDQQPDREQQRRQ